MPIFEWPKFDDWFSFFGSFSADLEGSFAQIAVIWQRRGEWVKRPFDWRTRRLGTPAIQFVLLYVLNSQRNNAANITCRFTSRFLYPKFAPTVGADLARDSLAGFRRHEQVAVRALLSILRTRLIRHRILLPLYNLNERLSLFLRRCAFDKAHIRREGGDLIRRQRPRDVRHRCPR
ncbi:MAG: hypothetical protein ABSA13_14020, partial [Beijerinckiaceae bacterium]